MSVLAVFPKFEIHREPEGELPSHFNPLFFGHYARIPKERYLNEMLRVVSDDGVLYRTIISDLYDQGVYLVRAKYRYLRASYTLFLLAFISAGIAWAFQPLCADPGETYRRSLALCSGFRLHTHAIGDRT